ncbi:MAG: DUF1801 domain-containing protein [Bacteroidota bacterium]
MSELCYLPNMSRLEIKTDPKVASIFKQYPKEAREKILILRKLILEVADEIGIHSLEEALKWGEPSYLAKKGSTLRIDWKEKKPNQYAMYFKCTSKLVPSFKKVFGDIFTYEGDRAIVFGMEEELPEKELKDCISVTFTYHKVKHLPNLGL